MNRTLLVLSGPTHEYIDPVRFIGNASSGLMGKAIAEEALRHNDQIIFISGPVAPTHLPDLGSAGQVVRVTEAEEMLVAAQSHFHAADVIIFAAAVADYTPQEKQTEKMAKSEEELILRLKATPDIAKTLCASKTENQIALGFALQTAEGEKNARRKLKSKNLDGIVLNTPATLGAESGSFSFLSAKNDAFEPWGTISKTKCAEHIFQALEKISREK
ncbi:phosphopantothenoylcysteine decarboxylase [Pontiella agarivorans]|uniref:Phosphopantothenoylcysteine decarboxylase n=1 Tax=Pontiella agarivorans TaxID=3038953 RepID=A0ABU5N1U1_9BACT|nr:phosphopantothenoylcysteine decarboxylase [Pontiella agarivorans]MDZ8120379.1 phosphopantothenoylcysteine decarboxylase [Pontiella agarivorans]